MLGGLMMADHAARSGPKQAMVTCKMPGKRRRWWRLWGNPWPKREVNSAWKPPSRPRIMSRQKLLSSDTS